MTPEEIRQKLDRYYNAETSPEEEEALRHYFLQDDVPVEWESDRLFFSATAAPVPHEPLGLEQRLSHSIDTWNAIERQSQRQARTMSLRWITGIAASLLAFVTLGTYLNHRESTAQPDTAAQGETYTDPHDAAGEAERALTKFSLAVNKGIKMMNGKENGSKSLN